MPKLKPDTQKARRERVLDAAEQCFARAGFHRTTMHDICREAGVSPGALYVYFASKEDLIAGLAERDRAEFQCRFEQVAGAPDVMQALTAIGESYFVDDPQLKQRMCIEIGIESTRNETVGSIYRNVDQHVADSFKQLFDRLVAEGRVAPELDTETLTQLLQVIGDGMTWRRAVTPGFDAARLMPVIAGVIGGLLRPADLPAATAIATSDTCNAPPGPARDATAREADASTLSTEVAR